MGVKDKDIILVKTGDKNEVEIGNHILRIVKNDGLVYLKTKQETKWVSIETEYLEAAKKIYKPKVVFDKWRNWPTKSKTPIEIYGIGKQYGVGTRVGINIHKEYLINGTIIYAEPFFYEPSFERGFYIAIVEEPKIISAYFASYKVKYPGEDNKTGIYTYKQTIRLFVVSHLVPNYTVGHHNFALFEVDIFDADGDKKVTEDPLRFYQKTHDGKFSVNTTSELVIDISEKWREKSNHKDTKDFVKVYYAKIKTTIYSREESQTDNDAFDLNNSDIIGGGNGRAGMLKFRNQFGTVAPNGDIVAVTLTPELYKKFKLRFINSPETKIKKASGEHTYTKKELNEGKYFSSKTGQNTLIKGQKAYFEVRYDLMDVILENYEVKKNNMMVVVGDVKYSRKNNALCKFSSIEVSQKDRKPVEIFNEEKKGTKAFVDNTKFAVSIVAGSINKETVTITLKGLATEFYNSKNVNCLGITKRIKIVKGGVKAKDVRHKKDDNFKHSSIEKVFAMDYAYILFPNRDHKTNASATNTEGNENMAVYGQDITFEHEIKGNSIDLFLKYIYNKNYNAAFKKWFEENVGDWTGDIINNLWLLNYFTLREDLAQKYFVPVTTCRYPNQMVLINVHPKIHWAVAFSFGKAGSKYLENWRGELIAEKKKLIELAEDKIDKVTKPFDRNNPLAVKKKKALKKLNLKLSIKASYDTTVVDFTPGFGKKINDLVYAFAVAKEFIDEMTGNTLSKEKQNSIYKNKVNKIKTSSKFTKAFKGKLLKLPVTITVDNPMISLGVAWGRKPYTDLANASTPVAYDIFVKADPLFKITGSLDLITCATFLPVAGQVIEVVRIVLEVAGAEPVFKISASGAIAVNGKGIIHDDAQSKNNHSIDLDVIATVKLMVEASITAKAGLVGFIFSGGDYKGLVTDTTVNAKAEVGFDATFGQGVNFSLGPYFKAQLGFLGLIAVGKKETKSFGKVGKEKELFRYTIIKPNPSLLGGTYYFNKD